MKALIPQKMLVGAVVLALSFAGTVGCAYGYPFIQIAPAAPPVVVAQAQPFIAQPAPVYAPAPPVVAAPNASYVWLSDDQIDQLTAPIALYPDPLLAQILPASTYPQEIATAAQWRQAYPNADDAAIDAQPWELSVRAVAHYPPVLQMMAGNLPWTQALGAAFLNQQGDVMQSIQRLRLQAQAEGALMATPQQQVVVDNGAVLIEPVEPTVICVPQYDPDFIFFRHHRGDHLEFGAVVHFGINLRIGGWLDNDCDWDNHWVTVGGGWHRGWRRDEREVRREDQQFRPPEGSRRWAHDPAKPVPALPPQYAHRAPEGGARPGPAVEQEHRGRVPGVPVAAPRAPAVPPAVPRTPEPVARPANPAARAPGAFGPYQSHTDVQRDTGRYQQSHTPTPPAAHPAPAPTPTPPAQHPAAPAPPPARPAEPATPHVAPPPAHPEPATPHVAAPAPPAVHSAPPAAATPHAAPSPAFRPSGSGAETHAESARGNSSLQQQQHQQPQQPQQPSPHH